MGKAFAKCLGGTNAGWNYEIDLQVNVYRFVKKEPLRAYKPFDYDLSLKSLDLEYYKVDVVVDKQGYRHYFLVLQGLDLFTELFSGYNRRCTECYGE